jgi:hypothetical protein
MLDVDMFAHNKSGVVYRDRNRRPETVVFTSTTSRTPQQPNPTYTVQLTAHLCPHSPTGPGVRVCVAVAVAAAPPQPGDGSPGSDAAAGVGPAGDR